MSSSGASAGLRAPGVPVEPEERVNSREGEAAAAMWVALSQQIQQQAPPALALSSAAASPPSAWRESAGDLTPTSTASAVSPAPQGEAAPPERLTVTVDGGNLGELSVTVDREHGELRVVVGMQNPALAQSIQPDARQLRAALETAGMTVRSLDFVAAAEVGTVLARQRTNPTGSSRDGIAERARDPEAERKKNPKRFGWIG